MNECGMMKAMKKTLRDFDLAPPAFPEAPVVCCE